MNRLSLALRVLLGQVPAAPPPATIGPTCAWNDPELENTRRAAALSLMDPDVEGFMLVQFHFALRGPLTPEVCHVVRPEWWPAIWTAVSEAESDARAASGSR